MYRRPSLGILCIARTFIRKQARSYPTLSPRCHLLRPIPGCTCNSVISSDGNRTNYRTVHTEPDITDEIVDEVLRDALDNVKPKKGVTSVSFDEDKLSKIIRKLLEVKVRQSEIVEFISSDPSDFGHSFMAWKTAVNTLKDLNFRADHILPMIASYPPLLSGKTQQMFTALETLRHLGFVDGQLQNIAYKNPRILYEDGEALCEVMTNMLREFPRRDCLEIMCQCTEIFTTPWAETLAKIDYGLEEMKLRKNSLLHTHYLDLTLGDIRARHLFLLRSDLYHTPNKKGETKVPNPTAKHMFNVTEEEFCRRLTPMSHEEFCAFKDMLKLEGEQDHLMVDVDVNRGYESEDEGSGRDNYNKK